MTSTITATGNLTGDVRMNYSENGWAWANGRLAVDQGYRDRKTGQWVDQGTDFYSIAAFGALAEQLADHYKSGDRIIITGRPTLQTYDRTDGTTSARLNVTLATVKSARLQPTSVAPTIERAAQADDSVEPTAAESANGETPVSEPTIAHGPAGTKITGVTKDDTELHALIKQAGFKYAARQQAWVQPADAGIERGQLRVDELVTAAAAAGIDFAVSSAQDVPPMAGPAPAATPAASTAPALTPIH